MKSIKVGSSNAAIFGGKEKLQRSEMFIELRQPPLSPPRCSELKAE
jgi:hypothetical protein